MLTEQQFRQICNYTRDYLTDSAARSEPSRLKRLPRTGEYRWQHTLNVLQNIEKIAAGERLDEGVTAVVRVAAILHDVSIFECDHAIHGRVSAEIAEKHLSEHGFPGDFVTRVSRAIAEHGSDFDTLTPVQMSERFSLEGKVLIEADILDKLGASAITNALLVQGQRGSLSFECWAGLEDGKAMQQAAFFKDYL